MYTLNPLLAQNNKPSDLYSKVTYGYIYIYNLIVKLSNTHTHTPTFLVSKKFFSDDESSMKDSISTVIQYCQNRIAAVCVATS